jgi:hypothetical protein
MKNEVKRSVYIDATVISYLTSKPTRNLLAAAWNEITVDWWENKREQFNLYVSALVNDEILGGDRQAALRRKQSMLTWNFRHMDNAETKPRVRELCLINGYKCPEICTPQELMGGEYYE